MKKLFIILLILLVAGAWVGQLMVQDPGYVLLSYQQTTVETSLWVLLLILVLGFALLHWLFNLVHNIRLPGDRLRSWRSDRNHRLARSKTLKGLVALSEGSWWKAQRYLTQAAQRSDLPVINYLAAARAAHEQGDSKSSDDLLNRARQSTPEAEVAISITQAEMQLERGQLEPSLATLLHLRRQAPKHTHVIRLLKEAYLKLEDWKGLTELLPELKRLQAMKDDELEQLELQCHLHQLEYSISSLPDGADAQERLRSLSRSWQSIPQPLLRNPVLVSRYTDLMIEIGAEVEVEKMLRDLIKRQWDEHLVRLYGRIQGENAEKQLNIARGWLKQHADSPGLELTLGRLSMRNAHWGKAINHFERSLELQPDAETFKELYRLLHHLGEDKRTLDMMTRELQQLDNSLPALPLPAPNSESH
ncbi:heme biosynthesis HemY N-terminal domain-containing protein [Marinobacterium iners]|uniref:HemY protein n=1 Tax=Marinobacterium iners DSM 11526 TaxID=1122198 RepID=A0A1H4DXD7_9GAMM|nr:heme biosynthesis HemY N-terminal domain-containing protein [Marinobacterium iners]SEA77444.1 HemY protein [Marinobacterium iners DSM 11526]